VSTGSSAMTSRTKTALSTDSSRRNAPGRTPIPDLPPFRPPHVDAVSALVSGLVAFAAVADLA